jgi:hypothetical protein
MTKEIKPVKNYGVCYSCIHQDLNKQTGDADCRRNPPMVFPVIQPPQIQGGQPITGRLSFFPPCPPDGKGCGEWSDEEIESTQGSDVEENGD